MVLKLAKSYAQTMISALLLFLQWKLASKEGEYTHQTIEKWFKLATRSRVANAYWDPRDKCTKNTSYKLLDVMNADSNDVYWAVNQVPPTPKHKCTQAEDKSMNNSVLTVKMAVSQKNKLPKSALKQTATTAGAETTIHSNNTHMDLQSLNSWNRFLKSKWKTTRFSTGLTSLQHKWKPSWLKHHNPIDAMPEVTEVNLANCYDTKAQQEVRRGPPTPA